MLCSKHDSGQPYVWVDNRSAQNTHTHTTLANRTRAYFYCFWPTLHTSRVGQNRICTPCIISRYVMTVYSVSWVCQKHRVYTPYMYMVKANPTYKCTHVVLRMCYVVQRMWCLPLVMQTPEQTSPAFRALRGVCVCACAWSGECTWMECVTWCVPENSLPSILGTKGGLCVCVCVCVRMHEVGALTLMENLTCCVSTKLTYQHFGH
jgi:hypothetical protein